MRSKVSIVVATMNSVDHSVTPLDQALLRRFWPETVPVLEGAALIKALKDPQLNEECRQRLDDACAKLDKLNAALAKALGREGMVGHSFVFEMKALGATKTAIANVWRYGIGTQVIEALRAAGKDSKWPDVKGAAQADANSPPTDAQIKAVRAALKDAGIPLVLDGHGLMRSLRLLDIGESLQDNASVPG